VSIVGTEWLVEAVGCDPRRLQDAVALRVLLDEVLRDLSLETVGQPLWHTFPPPGGVTGMYLLTESHLACHTYPEHRLATFNLYCCRPRTPWPWEARLKQRLGATQVTARVLDRGHF